MTVKMEAEPRKEITMEKLKLATGKTYDLVPNGVRIITKGIVIEFVKPEGETLEDIQKVFRDPEATKTMKVVNDETTLLIEEGYTKLGSRISLDTHASVGVSVVENEDGTTTSETQYAAVVSFEMYKETIEEKVEANRADIDYLLMMEG